MLVFYTLVLFTAKSLQHMLSPTLHTTESLAYVSQLNYGHKNNLFFPVCFRHYMCVKVVGVFAQNMVSMTRRVSSSQKYPPTEPPMEKCNHIFHKVGSGAWEKKVYQIHRHCHYAVHVVSPSYLWPLIQPVPFKEHQSWGTCYYTECAGDNSEIIM